MEEKILAALLDLQIALGELREAISDIDEAIKKLMAVQIDALESKTGEVPSTVPGDGKESPHA